MSTANELVEAIRKEIDKRKDAIIEEEGSTVAGAYAILTVLDDVRIEWRRIAEA